MANWGSTNQIFAVSGFGKSTIAELSSEEQEQLALLSMQIGHDHRSSDDTFHILLNINDRTRTTN